MSGRGSVQLQAVLYQTDPGILLRAIRAIDRAAETAAGNGLKVSLRWGDASETPVFEKAAWNAFTLEGPHLSKMDYRFFGENTGYGRGNNLLGLDSDADYLLIMNPEIMLPPHGIIDLTDPFRDPAVGMTEARQIPVEHPKEYHPETMETEWCSGACFMIPGALFQALKGFDSETFFMYCEDVDLSWRVRMAGRKLYYQPLCGVFHGRTLSERGENQASETERCHTVYSEAMLAYKWSYPEYARERITQAVRRGDPGGEEAMTLFRRKERTGGLPVFVDPEHRVAHIIQFPETGGMLFTGHRFQL